VLLDGYPPLGFKKIPAGQDHQPGFSACRTRRVVLTWHHAPVSAQVLSRSGNRAMTFRHSSMSGRFRQTSIKSVYFVSRSTTIGSGSLKIRSGPSYPALSKKARCSSGGLNSACISARYHP
jgi:hypothetical protein